MADHSSTHDSSTSEEPSTPLWVTLLGASLLVGAALYLLFPSGDEAAAGSAAPAAQAK